MRLSRTVTAIAVATGALLIHSNAFALATDNDGYAGRVVIGSTPFTATVDTTMATTDSDDTDLNRGCGAPATDASVWYEYTATSDGAIIDVSQSDYTAAVLVGVGGPGNWKLIMCAYGRATLRTSPGQPYAILAIDYQKDGGGNGGTLRLEVTETPPPPVIDMTVDPTGTVDPRTGIATVSGTATCTGGPVRFAYIDTQLQQQRNRFTVLAYNTTEITCDATTRPWTLVLESPNGPFGQGLASNITVALACGELICSADNEQRDIHLRVR